MILYHGSSLEILDPDLLHSRDTVDFGKGFYTTPLREQAEKWCQRFKRGGRSGVISCYTLDETALEVLNCLQFDTYSEQWLDFIAICRAGKDTSSYDIVGGGVANDKVFDTLELYFQNLIDKQTALGKLQYEKPNWQVCLRSAAALRYLTFEGSEII